jgi:multidrug efflux pump subunit AcrA (membrane-fusion protein)
MYADVRPEDPVGGVHPGKVTIVDRVVNAASGSFGVRVELPNPNLLIPSGLKCNVKFKGRDVPKERGALPPRL